MRRCLLIGLVVTVVGAGVAAGAATAAGPTPGFAPAGVVSRSGLVRYAASPRAGSTVVKVLRVADGKLLRSRTIRGEYGVPLVAYDGKAGGLTRDGKRLVLETAGPDTTRFVVLSTRDLKVRGSFAFKGLWAYDALSPDGRTVYLIQILAGDNALRYLVRAYDLALHKLVGGAITDRSEPESMTGYPLSRVESADGSWAYTLYFRPGAESFIHALDTRGRKAVCIDLAWKGNPDDMGAVRLTLSADGRQLVVRTLAGQPLATVAAPVQAKR